LGEAPRAGGAGACRTRQSPRTICMTDRPGFLTGLRRRLVFWTVGGLTLAGLGAVVAWRVLWPAAELDAAERALRQHDLASARAPRARSRARRPNDERALLLAARAARRSGACADAERFLGVFEARAGPTDASRLEWVLLGVQQGDFAGEEGRLQAAVARKH